MEELDRNAQQLHERFPALAEVLKWARKHGVRVHRKST
jgi:hypothetical protein